jgi:phage terminase large subunit-like protein
MTNLQLKTLQSLLRITNKAPPQHRLEEIQMALETRLQLYLQEQDKAGAKVYQELKKMMQNKTAAQIEKMGDPVTS